MTRTPLWERVIASSHEWLSPFVERDDREHFYDTAVRTDEWLLLHRRARDILRDYSWYGRLTGNPIELPEYELYHVATDPFETKNVYTPTHPEGERLRLLLLEWEREMMKTPVQPPATKEVQPYF